MKTNQLNKQDLRERASFVCTQEEKALIKDAAIKTMRTESSFMRSAAVLQAREVLEVSE